MKFDPLFRSEGNRLFRLSDGREIDALRARPENLSEIIQSASPCAAALRAGSERLTAVTVPYGAVALSDGGYNEEALAALRSYLKVLEGARCPAFLVPLAGEPLSDPDETDSFIKAAAHTARRVKDCASVVGFAVPQEFLDGGASCFGEDSRAAWFTGELSAKHAHYLFFVDENDVIRRGLRAEIARTALVLYKTESDAK